MLPATSSLNVFIICIKYQMPYLLFTPYHLM